MRSVSFAGLEVNAINSVQLSNHGAYPVVKGQRLNGEDLIDLADGLDGNGMLRHDHLLTGYIGTASMLSSIAALVKRLRALNCDLHYVCDPVMGDNGKLFLPAELVPIYREVILPLANTVTPNAFEAQQLTGIEVETTADAIQACQAIHNMGPSTVVITSLSDTTSSQLIMVASTKLPQSDGLPQQFKLELPRLHISDFAGPGDLFAALLLGWGQRLPGKLQDAVIAAACSVQAVLCATADAAGPAASDTHRTAEVLKQRELRLVSCQHLIQEPPLKSFEPVAQVLD